MKSGRCGAADAAGDRIRVIVAGTHGLENACEVWVGLYRPLRMLDFGCVFLAVLAGDRLCSERCGV